MCTFEMQKSRRRVQPNKKPPEGGSQSNPMIVDQAAIGALSTPLFRERRYPKKPIPANPRIIIAQVDGSGTAAEMVMVPIKSGSPILMVRSLTATVKLPPLKV